MTAQDIGNRLITDLIAQLEQLTLNALMTPGILSRQAHDQSFDFPIGGWSSATIRLPVGPFPAHQLTMPVENGLGFDDPNHILQLFDRTIGSGFQAHCQHHQHQFFPSDQPHGLALFALIDRQLPAQQQDLKLLIADRSTPELDQIDQH